MKKLPRAEIHLVRLDGTTNDALTSTGLRCIAPSFAPAGKPRLAFIEQRPNADRLRVVSLARKDEAAFEQKEIHAFVWDISGTSLYALCLAGRSRGRVMVCELRSGKQLEATVVANVDEASLATNSETNTAWLAAKNPETRIMGLFKMKSTGNVGPWSLVLRMPGAWSSLTVHPVSGLVHGLVQMEGTQLVNEGKPRSPVELYFRGVHTKQPHHQQVALSPDGTTLAFLHNGEVHVVNAPGTDARKLTSGSKGECGPPAWHPDGAHIAYVRNSEICLLDVATGKSVAVPGTLAADDRVTFSPDGQGIAYSHAME